ncbi:uncharacterized protein LOC135491307 [Lineus longissimus]|uniref:uncharacterized protein LOC135491307 n=1 Tax=Lineus longissimus TaxID=88925 RepID=UPI002B4E86F6
MGCRPSKADFLSARFGEDSAYSGDRSEITQKHASTNLSNASGSVRIGGQRLAQHNDYGMPYSANTKRTLSHSSSEFSTVTTISGTSKIRVTLSSDGSMIEVEKYEPWDAFPSPLPALRANTRGGLDNAGFRSDGTDTDQTDSPTGIRKSKPPPKMHSMPNLRLSVLGDSQRSHLPRLEKKKNYAQFFSKKHDKTSKFSTLKHSKTESNVPSFRGEHCDRDLGLDVGSISRSRSPKFHSEDMIRDGDVNPDSQSERTNSSSSQQRLKLPTINRSNTKTKSDKLRKKDGPTPSKSKTDCPPKTLVVDLHNPSEIQANTASDLSNGNLSSTEHLSNENEDVLDLNTKSPNLPKSSRKSSSAGKRKTGLLFRKTKSDLTNKSSSMNDFVKKSESDSRRNVTHSENSSMDISSDFEDDLALALKTSEETKLEFDLAKIQVHQDFFNDFGDNFNDDDFMNS